MAEVVPGIKTHVLRCWIRIPHERGNSIANSQQGLLVLNPETEEHSDNLAHIAANHSQHDGKAKVQTALLLDLLAHAVFDSMSAEDPVSPIRNT